MADLLYSRFRCFSGVVLVAKQPDAIVGICGWQQDEGFGLLGPILIRKDKRRWGGGTHLVEQAVDEMRTEGIRTIESAYLSEDPCGQRLFTRCRFKTLGNETFPDGSEWTRVERKLKKTG